MSIPADICAFADNKAKPEEIERGCGTRGKLRRNKGKLTLETTPASVFRAKQTISHLFLAGECGECTHIQLNPVQIHTFWGQEHLYCIFIL